MSNSLARGSVDRQLNCSRSTRRSASSRSLTFARWERVALLFIDAAAAQAHTLRRAAVCACAVSTPTSGAIYALCVYRPGCCVYKGRSLIMQYNPSRAVVSCCICRVALSADWEPMLSWDQIHYACKSTWLLVLLVECWLTGIVNTWKALFRKDNLCA